MISQTFRLAKNHTDAGKAKSEQIFIEPLYNFSAVSLGVDINNICAQLFGTKILTTFLATGN
jgi:hypothetical protein